MSFEPTLRVAVGSVMICLCVVAAAFAQQGAAGGQWPYYAGDIGSTKYAPLDQIDDGIVEQDVGAHFGPRVMTKRGMKTDKLAVDNCHSFPKISEQKSAESDQIHPRWPQNVLESRQNCLGIDLDFS